MMIPITSTVTRRARTASGTGGGGANKCANSGRRGLMIAMSVASWISPALAASGLATNGSTNHRPGLMRTPYHLLKPMTPTSPAMLNLIGL
jgi:hypothetical protein